MKKLRYFLNTRFVVFKNTAIRQLTALPIVFITFFALSAVLSFVKIITYSKILGPTIFGAWELITVVAVFSPYVILFGLDQGLSRQAGRFYISGNIKNIVNLRNKVLTVSLIMSSIVGLCYFFFIQAWFSYDPLMKEILISAIPYALGTIFTNLLFIEYRAKLEFNTYAKLIFYRSALTLFFGVFLAYKGGSVLWIAVGEFTVNFIIFVFITFKLKNIRLNFSLDKYFILMIKQFSIFNLSAVVRTLVRNIDRFIIAYTFTLANLGYYAFGMILVSLCLVINNIVSSYFEPHWVCSYKKNRNISNVKIKLLKFIFIFLCVALSFYYPFIEFYKWIVAENFTKFVRVFEFIHWIYFGAVFHVINYSENIFLAVGRGKTQLLVTLISSFVAFIIIGSVAIFSPSLINFSIGFFAISMSSFFIGMFFVFKIK
jgi:O-antigen/teichoic acid export membrane protein